MYFTPKRLKLYLCALLILQLFVCLGFRSSIRSGAIDFRSYYTAGYMLRTHHTALLYDLPTEHRLQNTLAGPLQFTLLFFAPPFAALPFALLSFAPFKTALLLFAVLNLALLALAVRVMRPHLRALTTRWPATPTLLFLSFLPTGLTLVMGQLSIFLLLICCLAFALLETGSLEPSSPFLAGLIFSLALVKFQLALPVALLFLLWRRWRFTLGFLLGATLLAALSAAILSPHNLPSYLRSLTQTSALAGTTLQSAVGLSPRRMANLYALFFALTPTNRLATALTAIASIALLAWATTRRPSFPLALLVAILVNYHLYPCDLTLLLLPISLLSNRLFAEDPTPTAAPTPQPSPLARLQNHRRAILFCALGTFLISPVLIELIVNDLIFLLALPILALALCPLDWSTLTLPRATDRTTQLAVG